jgi:hypothetical protein
MTLQKTGARSKRRAARQAPADFCEFCGHLPRSEKRKIPPQKIGRRAHFTRQIPRRNERHGSERGRILRHINRGPPARTQKQNSRRRLLDFWHIASKSKSPKLLRQNPGFTSISLDKTPAISTLRSSSRADFWIVFLGPPRRAGRSKSPKVDRCGNFVSRQKRQNARRQNAQPQAKPRLELARFLSPKIASRQWGDITRHPERSEGSREPNELPDSSQSLS